MKNTSTVIFLDYFENLEKVVPIIQRIRAKEKFEPIIVSSNFDAQLINTYLGLKIIYYDELLAKQDYEFMSRYVFNLIENWYAELKPVEGITEYKGIKFGAVVEERVEASFAQAIRSLEIALKIIERFQPHKIILIGEKDNFQKLSMFIKENLNIPSLFIEVREKNSSVSEIIKAFRCFLVEVITNISDNLIRIAMVRKKQKNGIFIDAWLYFELKELIKEYYPYLYLIEKGFRIRLRLIKEEKIYYSAILTETFFKIPYVFNRFYRYWRFIKRDAKFKNSFNYKGLKIWQFIEKIIGKFITCNFYQVNNNIVFLEKLYKCLEPKIVIAREAVRIPEKTIVLTAKQAGIPTLVIQHGMLSEAYPPYRKLHSDKIALWGKAAADWYLAYGNDITKCVITGKLQHDLLYSKKDNYENEGKNLLLKIGADSNKVTILYIPSILKTGPVRNSVYRSSSKDSEFFALNSILNIAESFPDKQLIIKIHPFDLVDLNSLRDNPKIKKFPNIFIVKNADVMPLIKVSSLVIISLFSSCVLDAVIFNKPIISLNFYKRDYLIPFVQRGVMLSVTEPERLCQAVRQIFEDRKLGEWFASNRESFIYDYAYKIDGKCSQRVKDIIRKLAHNK